ncbi:MAG: hypothetical protein EXR62_03885, partial [Chloroflexi bacterium]|nr:hypothetical protein [Chloroflexota bacterium]
MPTTIISETCPAPECNLTEQDVTQSLAEMQSYMGLFETAYQRAAQWEWSKVYLQGLLGNTLRKNVEQIALDLGKNVRSLQHFIGQSPWQP